MILVVKEKESSTKMQTMIGHSPLMMALTTYKTLGG